MKTDIIVWYNLFLDSFIFIETPFWVSDLIDQEENDYWIRLGEL